MADKPSEPLRGELLPVLPLRDIVVFPHMIVPLFVGREKSVRALEAVMRDNKQILLVAQKNAAQDDPEAEDLFEVGTVSTVLQLLKLPDGTVKVLVEGGRRARIAGYKETKSHFEAYRRRSLDEAASEPPETEALARTVVGQFEQYIKLNKKIAPEVLVSINQIDDPAKLADTVAGHLSLKIPEKQELLEIVGVGPRLERVFAHMESEIGVLQVEKRIRNRVKRQMEKTQREYYLNEQLKAIQKELGEGEDGKDEAAELEARIKNTKLSKEAHEKAMAELKKLRTMSPMSAEATVVRNYLDWMLSIPWKKKSKIRNDIVEAEKVLDNDHYGLEKVKERIIEYLAVQSRSPKIRGPILCLVGPPGVGKTSLGKSIAKATGRNFVRMSLGGVRDEAEMRGHRRTYIGSMPGKVVQGMKKAKTSNPLFLLDEIDKLGADWRGDPSSALLEVLDPEQNSTFNDHYLEVDYDLSDVMFVTTANSPPDAAAADGPHGDHPHPRLHRGREDRDRQAPPGRQAVRGERAEGGRVERRRRGAARPGALLHARGRRPEPGARDRRPGPQGGARDRLQEGEEGRDHRREPRRLRRRAEVPLRRGGGRGHGGRGHRPRLDRGGRRDPDHRERARCRARARCSTPASSATSCRRASRPPCPTCGRGRTSFGIKPTLFEKRDIHVHVPEGATPKDGPSAGIAMATSIVSVLTGIPVRRDVAMTGEITLRGRVLPIGGLKEKLLAALRAGVTTVFIPKDNEKDLAEIPDNVKKDLAIHPVSHVDEVIARALARPPEAIEWEEPPEPPAAGRLGDGVTANLPH